MALDKLAVVWKSREDISKLAAGSLINTPDLFISLADLYSGDEREALQQVEHQVLLRISQCLC